MNRAVLKAIAAACLTLAGASAFAAASSTATYSSVKITLIDLNLTDGVAPSISFLPAPQYLGGAYLGGEAYSYASSQEFSNFERMGRNAGASVSDGAYTTLASSTGSVTGAANGAGFSAMSVSGVAQSTVDGSGHYSSFASVPAAIAGQAFTLSANTAVRFSLVGSVDAAYTIGYTPQSPEGEFASALLTLMVSGADAGGLGDLVDYQQAGVGVHSNIGDSTPGPDSDSWNGMLNASYSNLSTHSSLGHFYAEASVSGLSTSAVSAVSAVPEPGAYAMLLAGLGMIGAVARRRRAV